MKDALYCLLISVIVVCSATELDDHNNYFRVRNNFEKNRRNFPNVEKLSIRRLEHKYGGLFDIEKILKNVETQDDSSFDRAIEPMEDSAVSPGPPVLSTSTPFPKVSARCLNDTQKMLQGLTQSEQWAINMIDALAKPHSGILTGEMTWLGNYKECIAADSGSFQGKYCLQSLLFTGIKNPLTQAQGIEIKAGVCIPNSCSDTDLKNLLNSALSNLSNNTVFAGDTKCQEPDIPYDTRAKVALGVISLFIAIMAIATAYDVISTYTSKSDGYNLETKPEDTKKAETNLAYMSDDKTLHIESDLKYKMKEVVNTVTNKERNSFSYRTSSLGKILLSFSVYTNGAKILNTKQGEGTLTAVNGIRFISMTWVILGHTFAFGLGTVSNLADLYKTFLPRYSFMAIINAEVSVDSFFALSGCLLTYLVLKQLKKQQGKLNWFMFYFHRFWRLTPPYMLVLMVYLSLFAYLGSGPFWKKDGPEKDHCKTTWFYNLLYINNFVKGAEECFAHAWYLANDMQFFVISPLILIPLYRSKVAGTVVTGIFLLLTTIASAVVSKHYKLKARIEGDYFDVFYQRPYCRMGPYLVGMYTGFLLYTMKCTCNINKYLNLFLWAVFGTMASAVLYGVYNEYNGDDMTVDVAAFYNAVHKPVWGAAVCWVIFACATGNGGFINTILSWKAFVPLGRLTYCAYLVHPSVQYYYYGSRKQLLYWDDHSIIYEYLGHLGIAYSCAFVTSLAFEAPMMALEKVIFKR